MNEKKIPLRIKKGWKIVKKKKWTIRKEIVNNSNKVIKINVGLNS